MRNLPVVYIERELLIRACGSSHYTVAYIPSKAYLLSKTETYLENGSVKKSYEVDYMGYEGANEYLEEIGFMMGEGYSAPKARVYSDFDTCKEMTQKLNDELFTRRISSLDEADSIRKAREYDAIKNLIVSLEERYLLEDNQNENE